MNLKDCKDICHTSPEKSLFNLITTKSRDCNYNGMLINCEEYRNNYEDFININKRLQKIFNPNFNPNDYICKPINSDNLAGGKSGSIIFHLEKL